MYWPRSYRRIPYHLMRGYRGLDDGAWDGDGCGPGGNCGGGGPWGGFGFGGGTAAFRSLSGADHFDAGYGIYRQPFGCTARQRLAADG